MQEIAANINNQDLEQYANFFGLNQICKTKWASPHWPPSQHPMTSESSSPTNENDENVMLQDGSELIDGKDDDSNLLMTIDQSGYPPQFTVEQLQFITQLQVSFLKLPQLGFASPDSIFAATASVTSPNRSANRSAHRPEYPHASRAELPSSSTARHRTDHRRHDGNTKIAS